MGFIQSLRDLVGANAHPAPTAVGVAAVPAPSEDDQPTIGLPRTLVRLNVSRGYVGRRLDIKARNRNAGPHHRTSGAAL